MPIEYEIYFGRVIKKDGSIIKLVSGELDSSREFFETIAENNEKLIIPIIPGVATVNCVQRTYIPKEDSDFEKLFVYNY